MGLVPRSRKRAERIAAVLKKLEEEQQQEAEQSTLPKDSNGTEGHTPA